MVAIIEVFVRPPSESCRILVNLLSLEKLKKKCARIGSSFLDEVASNTTTFDILTEYFSY